MADAFRIIPYQVRSAGTDVPPEEVQAGLNSLANQTTIALNTLNTGESSNVNITGGTITGVTGATQSRIDNSLLLATDAFVNQQIASSQANVPIPLTGGVYNQASRGTGTTFVIFATGGVISSVITIVTGGTGYAVGDLLLVVGGNTDALLRVTNVSGGVIQSGGLQVLYGGTGYTTALTLAAVPVPPGQRTVTATGVLTSNVTFIIQNGTFLTAARRIQFNNNTTGAFTTTVFLSNGIGGTTGTGFVVPQGTNNSSAVLLETDGANDVWLADTPLGIGAATSNNAALTGTPTAPTAATNTNTTQLATTAFVEGEFANPPATGFGSGTARPVAATTIAASSTITPSQTAGIVGTTTNNNANAGSVGEFASNTTSGTSLTTTIGTNATSVSLTAGDWDVQAILQCNPAATTNITTVFGAVNTTSGSVGALGNYSKVTFASTGVAPNSTVVVTSPVVRVSLASTTTVFAVANAAFTVSTMTVDGFIRARRVR